MIKLYGKSTQYEELDNGFQTMMRTILDDYCSEDNSTLYLLFEGQHDQVYDFMLMLNEIYEQTGIPNFTAIEEVTTKINLN